MTHTPDLRRLFSFCLFGVVTLAFAAATTAQNANNAGAQALKFNLPKQTLQKLEGVIVPAYESGNLAGFMEATLDLIQRSEFEHFEEIERYGFNHGISSIKTEFGQKILKDVEQGIPPRISSLRLSTVIYINSYFVEQIENELTELRAHDVMHEPLMLPDTWAENEKLFWEVHVYRNRMDSVNRLADFVVEMSRPLYVKAERKRDQKTMDLLQPVSTIKDKVAEHVQKMYENEAELRLMELERVAETLEKETDFQTRLAAAFALSLDEAYLLEFFSQVDPATLTRPRLKNPDIGQGIKALVGTARHYGEDDIEKALLLRTGAHWWLRGRYGMGPLAWGLLKKPEALDNEEAMFGLYMPRERPQPVNWVSTEGQISPGYERRHHYTWMVEYRELRVLNGSFTQTSQKVELGPQRISGAVSKTFW